MPSEKVGAGTQLRYGTVGRLEHIPKPTYTSVSYLNHLILEFRRHILEVYCTIPTISYTYLSHLYSLALSGRKV